MSDLCNVKIHINGQETFFLNEKILCAYSEELRKLVKQESKIIEIDDFPGGPEGFEMVLRFCHNNGEIVITVKNVALLYCCSIFLGIDNLLRKAEEFLLEGIEFYWSFKEVLFCLKSCEPFLSHAESSSLLEKLVFALSSKIAQSSWWFDELTVLTPKIVEKLVSHNKSLTLTKFSLHYLKLASTRRRAYNRLLSPKSEFFGLVDKTFCGVLFLGKECFSCRSLFRVLRLLSGFGLSKDSRLALERLIGEALDEASLDDLLISGHHNNNCGVYDVNLVIRLVRVFVSNEGVSLQKLRKVGRVIDKYLCEISPDQTLKTSIFLGVAESVPDSARDSFDQVYRAIDIYFQSHPSLSCDERSKLCRCLNYKKLSLEACKELAKNPKIPPRIAMEALISQHLKVPTKQFFRGQDGDDDDHDSHDFDMNLQRMQKRVVELEKVCREMEGQMSIMVRNDDIFQTPSHPKALH